MYFYFFSGGEVGRQSWGVRGTNRTNIHTGTQTVANTKSVAGARPNAGTRSTRAPARCRTRQRERSSVK